MSTINWAGLFLISSAGMLFAQASPAFLGVLIAGFLLYSHKEQ